MLVNNSILTDLNSLLIRNNLNSASDKLSTSLMRMSSGFKINQAKDDATGCVISTNIQNEIRGTYQAQRNIQDGISLLGTAQGAYENMSDILTRLRDLSLMAMDDTYDQDTRKAIENEAAELTDQLEQIRKSASYNGISLFDNSKITDSSAKENADPTNPTQSTNTVFSLRNPAMRSANSTNIETNDTSSEISIKEIENTETIQTSVENENINPEEEPIAMMSMARSASVEPVAKTTISFNKNETKILNIGNNSYQIQAGNDSNYLNFSYQQDADGKITFDGRGFAITSLNNEASNIVLKNTYMQLYLNSTNDIVEVKGTGCKIFSEGGNNEIKISGEQTRLILNGNGNDTVYSSSSYANQYIYLGEGDDDISNLKINNSVVTKKSGNVNYKLSNLTNCTLLNINKTDSDFQFVEVKSESTITVNGRQYKIRENGGNSKKDSHVFYKYDNEKQRIVFVSYNANITALTNSSEKSLIYGVDNKFNGTSKNDDILVGVGSFNCEIYGKDGNDLLVTEEYYTAYSNYLYGGNGDDTLIGNSKTGYWGENDDDTIIVNVQASSSGATGGAGDDLFEVNGKTAIYDTSGDNTYYINTDNITADVGGSTGTFIINGNNNTITGTDGDDYFEINGSNNKIDGGNGDNYYVDNNNNASNNVQGALDANTNGKLTFNSQNEMQTLIIENKEYTIKNNASGNNLLYWNYENGKLKFTGNNLNIIASDKTNHNIAIEGNNNTIQGSNKNDIIDINGTNNYIYGNNGDDVITLNFENNAIDGGLGNDTINLNATSNLDIKGGDGNNTFNFNADNLNVQSGNGNDTIKGRTNNSTIDLGSGKNNIEISGKENTIVAKNDENSVKINGDSNSITVDKLNDFEISGDSNTVSVQNGTIIGSLVGNSNTINITNAQNSDITIKGNANKFNGSVGEDILTINGNNNIVDGKKGDDNFKITSGDSNEVDGGMGRNVLYNQGTNTKYSNIINITPKPFDLNLQIGCEANETIGIRIMYNLGDFELKFNNSEDAKENIEKIDNLMKQIDEQLSDIGSTQSRLESIYELNNKKIQNLSLSNSIIKDTDIAVEAINFAQAQIIKDISSSLFTQANNIRSNLALKLLSF